MPRGSEREELLQNFPWLQDVIGSSSGSGLRPAAGVDGVDVRGEEDWGEDGAAALGEVDVEAVFEELYRRRMEAGAEIEEINPPIHMGCVGWCLDSRASGCCMRCILGPSSHPGGQGFRDEVQAPAVLQVQLAAVRREDMQDPLLGLGW